MIGVAIVGLLAMVALPSFLESIRKGRRSEAFAAISAIQQAQERWRGSNATYAAALSSLAVPNVTGGVTASGNYSLSIAGADASSYAVTASGVAGTSQANDACRYLSVKMNAGAISYASCKTCTPPFEDTAYHQTDVCWSK